MKVAGDRALPAEEKNTAESLALARWYGTHPSIRRLVGITIGEGLRVIVAIDPTLDDDDILPVWLANTRIWTKELCMQTGRSVQLEVTQDLSADGVEVDPDSSLIADLFWRDAALDEPHEIVEPTATSGVLDDATREFASRISCVVCQREIPLSASVSREASDYVEYFCGLDFSEWWHKQSPSPE